MFSRLRWFTVNASTKLTEPYRSISEFCSGVAVSRILRQFLKADRKVLAILFFFF